MIRGGVAAARGTPPTADRDTTHPKENGNGTRMRPPCNVDAGAGRHDRPPTGTRRPERTDRRETNVQPGDIDVWLGLDVGKSSHHACALDHDGNTILDTPVDQDEKQLRRTIVKLQRRGTVLVIVDQPNTIGSLPLTVASGLATMY